MSEGSRVRHHTKLRLSLFNPCKVKNSPQLLSSMRTTMGLKKDGSTLVIINDWHNHDVARRQLDQD